MGESEYILHVGDRKFLLRLNEALEVAAILNSATRIEEEWLKDVPNGQRHVFKPPAVAASYITPLTAHLRLEIATNMKTLEDKK